MNWKFRHKLAANKSKTAKERLGGPTTIPEDVAQFMVVELRKEAERVWYLKAVMRPCRVSKHLLI